MARKTATKKAAKRKAARPSSAEVPDVPTSLRISPEMLERIDTLRGQVMRGERVSRANVMRLALRIGVEALEEQHG